MVVEKTIKTILKINKKPENIEKFLKKNKFEGFELLYNKAVDFNILDWIIKN